MTPTDKRAYYRNPCNSRRMVRGWCSAWQPIETAPKDGGVSVLLYVRNSKHWKGEEPATMCVGYWADFNGGRWVHGSIGEPTHWMALPPPPGDAQESHL